ncbi:SbcC/MukB-like Walker B domain-containing protein [Kitasatospora sp. NPDC004669]|uniref:SbcC/MukB-like Walker B domain-containing protein n=1 Tax=Kitasatospora sp. NPDC004669 TaxID=3154555 RepID=UPI0033AF44C7
MTTTTFTQETGPGTGGELDDPERPMSWDRHERRWHLTEVGVSNVWKYTCEVCRMDSGRLMWLASNGVGKTTLLEMTVPFLLDLDTDPRKLSVGTGRHARVEEWMRLGADDSTTRRIGYLWLAFEGPRSGRSHGERQSYGVRIEFTANATQPVVLVPFRLPEVAVTSLTLHGEDGDAVTREDFAQQVSNAGGQVFSDTNSYRADLARRLFGCAVVQLTDLCTLIRRLRDPRLLQSTKVSDAQKALSDALPNVSEALVAAVSQALTEAAATRARYEHRRRTADLTADLAYRWSGHCAALVADLLGGLDARIDENARSRSAFEAAAAALALAQREHRFAQDDLAERQEQHRECKATEQAARDEAMRSDEQITATRREIGDCENLVTAKRQALHSAVAADGVAHASLLQQARVLENDINALAARAHGSETTLLLAEQPVTARGINRPDLLFGGEVLPQADRADIHADPAALERMRTDVYESAERHRQRAAQAEVVLADHAEVADADDQARQARALATMQAERAAQDREKSEAALGVAQAEAAAYTGAVVSWAAALPGLGLTPHPRPPQKIPGTELFTPDGIRQWAEECGGLEPAAVLAAGQELARHAKAVSGGLLAWARERAAVHEQAATERRQDAQAARRESHAYANGRLPAFPVPAWASPADEDQAFGAALTWAADAPSAGAERDLLEAAIAATGLLGATLGQASIEVAGAWRIDLDENGTEAAGGLDQVLAALPGHPHAEAVTRALRRVTLADSATHAADTSLAIGRDGTYRTGPALGRIPGADDPAVLRRAHLIGLDSRQAEAARRAREARLRADRLDHQAQRHLQVRDLFSALTDALGTVIGALPDSGLLDDAERNRAAAALIADGSEEQAAQADEKAQLAEAAHDTCLARWRTRAEELGLPGDVERLRRALTTTREGGRDLTEVADGLARLLERVRDLADQLADHALDQGHHEGAVLDLQANIDRRNTLRARLTAQLAARDAADRGIHLDHQAAVDALDAAARALRRAISREKEAELAARNCELDLAGAQAAQTGQETIDAALTALRTVLEAKGVAGAIGVDPALPVDDLRATLSERLGVLPRSNGGEVHAAADLLAAHLRDQSIEDEWRLEWEKGESPGGVLPVRLARPGAAYAPPKAADLTAAASTSAEQELNAAEQELLDNMVIGEIPAAIGAAWQELEQWIRRTNKLMRMAAASSGVGVQIRRSLRPGLSPGLRRIHELTCKDSRASRTPEQEAEVRAELLAQLRLSDEHVRVSAADTIERLKAIVDITSWIDLSYIVQKPGQPEEKLTDRRTTVSGGERRLVILAPMLAALAAEHDKLDPAAPRLAALDEVPAEVDAAGKDGLARYLSHLDLDLLCTSHGWDGSPGSWDGIDIYALEKLPDGTVASSPMHIREARLVQALEGLLAQSGA